MYVGSVSAALEFRTGTPPPLNYPWTKVPLKGKWLVVSDLTLEMLVLHPSYLFPGEGEVTFTEQLLGARNFRVASCFRGIVIH